MYMEVVYSRRPAVMNLNLAAAERVTSEDAKNPSPAGAGAGFARGRAETQMGGKLGWTIQVGIL